MGQCYTDKRENGSALPDNCKRTKITPAFLVLPEYVHFLPMQFDQNSTLII